MSEPRAPYRIYAHTDIIGAFTVLTFSTELNDLKKVKRLGLTTLQAVIYLSNPVKTPRMSGTFLREMGAMAGNRVSFSNLPRRSK